MYLPMRRTRIKTITTLVGYQVSKQKNHNKQDVRETTATHLERSSLLKTVDPKTGSKKLKEENGGANKTKAVAQYLSLPTRPKVYAHSRSWLRSVSKS